MSPSIWTRCAGRSEIRRLDVAPFRAVESQHVTSTRKLVDSVEEHDVLEELLDGVKPPAPGGSAFEGLHYLLSTPFRHPPLRYGSRFGTRAERGIWYGALSERTCFAEVAYYRLVFLEGTEAELAPLEVPLTLFQVAVRTSRGVDLGSAAFDRGRTRLESPTAYDATQRLGSAMRADGVEAFLYRSARDPARGTNVGLFEPCFAGPPRRFRSYVCTADRAKVEVVETRFRAAGARGREVLVFPRTTFEVRGTLPSPST